MQLSEIEKKMKNLEVQIAKLKHKAHTIYPSKKLKSLRETVREWQKREREEILSFDWDDVNDWTLRRGRWKY